MKLYRKKGTTPMEPWAQGMDLTGVSVGDDDVANGSPKPGDMIAHDPENLSDRWLINAGYFASNYEEA